MMNRNPFPLALAISIFSTAALPVIAEKALVDCINPMIGASTMEARNPGKTFPGAATPFGLVQLSPDTITGGDNGPGYSYEHTSIEGFSFTHMSGVGWYGDFGNFLVTPTVGPLRTACGDNSSEDQSFKNQQSGSPKYRTGDGYRSHFRHETEVAQAGYYAVTLDDYQIRAETTCAPHAGILRFKFPKSGESRIQIDLARRIAGTSTRQYVKVVDADTIEGWMKCPPEGGGWGHGGGGADYTVYFSARFSRPLKKFGVWSAKMPSANRGNIESAEFRAAAAHAQVIDGCREMEGDHLGFFAEFPTGKGEQILFKAGISFVSVAGARQNLEHDIPNWNFDSVRREARALWNDALSGVSVEGGTAAQREIFATALYHALIDPRAFSDVNGLYTGADLKVHSAEKFVYRTIFSGWDVFRAEYPLLTIVRPDVVNDTVNSLMQQAELSGNGYLARWEIVGHESGCMIGDPAVSVFADAYLKSIRGYDVQKAYALCRQSVMGPKSSREDLQDYDKLGFVPRSISWTLEDAYFDYCTGRFAQALGKTNDAAFLLKRSLNYRNIYDPSVGNMRAKNADGSWTQWKGATTEGQGCVESNPYQQGWWVPHDVPGLITLMGRDHFLNYLNEFFEKTPSDFEWNEYDNHANEPVHQTPYLFVYAGKPSLTQKWSRFVMDNAYKNSVYGISGNDDVGQMSAWYVLSAIGFYPVSPVDGVYIIGSPIFQKVHIRLDSHYYSGREFTVIAHNNSPKNIYIQSAKLNGKPLNRAWIRHREIAAGGTLEFVMGPEPNNNWGTELDTTTNFLDRVR
ncbi:MAG TPA: GH92 family glycosyl hydrolase [Verrucomicrobiae bacterium]